MHLHLRVDDDAGKLVSRWPACRWTVLPSDEALRAALPEIEYLFAGSPPRRGWAAAKGLRLLQLGGAGVDHFLPASELPDSVQLCNARGVFAAEAAEYAMAAVLALWRRIPDLVEQQRRHAWRLHPSPRLEGRTIAVLGLGEIGSRVARAAAALGMRVVGARRRPCPTEHVERVVGPEGIPALLAAADCVVVTLPRTEDTEGLLGRTVLQGLRPGSVLVAISRGGIIDADAVAELARAGRIRGAAFDVFDDEPLAPDNPLWDTPNVLVSPHCAGYGEDYLARALELFVQNARRIARGEPPRNVVDRVAGY